MNQLRAGDALNKRIPVVSADTRPADLLNSELGGRPTHVAVLDDGRFCGLAGVKELLQCPPGWIFGDLVSRQTTLRIPAQTPLEQIFRTLHDQGVDAAAVVDGAGAYLGAVTLEDIGQRLAAEQTAAAQMTARFAQFCMDRAADPVFWIAPDSEILYVNDAACRALGYTREELVGKTVPDINPNFPREAWPAHWDEVKRQGSFTFECDHPTRDGRILKTEFTVNYIKHEGREFNCAMMRDITERKRMEQSLRLAHFSMEHAADSIFWIAPNSEIVNVNDSACRVLGYAREELMGKTISDIDPHFPHEAWPAHWDEVKRRGSITFESQNVTQDGRMIDVEIVGNYIQHEAVEFICTMWRDITERKSMKTELEIRRAEVAHASRLSFVGGMAAGLAHEVNQPLTAIQTYATCGLERINSGSSLDLLRDDLEQIKRQVERAGAVIRHIRDFVKSREPHRSTADINEVVQDSISFIRDEIARRSIHLTVRLGDRLPLVLVDRIQIGQVVLNLLQNAIDAITSVRGGDPELTVTTSYDPSGSVHVAVSDRGPGLPPESGTRLFAPFFTTKIEGLGLGLSISQAIIESHKGRIWTVNNTPKGVTFLFSLPTHESKT